MSELHERLDRAVRQRLDQSRRQLEAAGARLDALSPLNVLARGYSLTRKETTGAIVRSVEEVEPGERLVTSVAGGKSSAGWSKRAE